MVTRKAVVADMADMAVVAVVADASVATALDHEPDIARVAAEAAGSAATAVNHRVDIAAEVVVALAATAVDRRYNPVSVVVLAGTEGIASEASMSGAMPVTILFANTQVYPLR